VVKWKFITTDKKKIYFAGIFSTIVLMSGNFFFYYNNQWFIPFLLFNLVTCFYLFLSYFVGLTSKDFNIHEHNKVYSKPNHYHDVDVFLPVCGEPIHVLRNTWEGVRDMIGCMKVFVLDDGNSKEVKDLAFKFGFNYFSRPEKTMKKAGNLKFAYEKTSSPFVLILDADFRPHPDLLVETLNYFDHDPKIAIVQTPQWFEYSPENSWIKNAAGTIQELFYRLIQVNRNHFNGSICVGTNAIYRRSALDAVGGTAQIEYSEDVHTGFSLIAKGYKIQYLPIILAKGECPETLQQYFTQQYRWSMGSISLFFSTKFWKAQISLMQRVCYLTGMFYYMSTGIGILFIGIPSIIMLAFAPDKILWFNLIFSVPSFLFSTVFMKYWSKEPFNFDVIRARLISYYAHLFALRDFLNKSLEEWKPTGSKTSSRRYQQFENVFIFHSITIPIIIFAGAFHLISIGKNPLDLLLLIFFNSYHAFISWPVIKRIFDATKTHT
jgi:cellulose synthase/poly-beta-1,6-N-acetylglucosamine synthase-like glycosyltransferase